MCYIMFPFLFTKKNELQNILYKNKQRVIDIQQVLQNKMGVDFYCENKTFGCSYSSWNNIRNDMVIATFRYLEELLKTMEEKIANKPKNEYNMYEDDEDNTIERNIIDLKQLLRFYDNNKRNIENLVGCIHNMNLQEVDALILFNLGGLYALCHKADCEGYYSVGNSYDILEMLNIVKPYVDLTYGEEWFNDLTNLFQESVDLKKKIVIC